MIWRPTDVPAAQGADRSADPAAGQQGQQQQQAQQQRQGQQQQQAEGGCGAVGGSWDRGLAGIWAEFQARLQVRGAPPGQPQSMGPRTRAAVPVS